MMDPCIEWIEAHNHAAEVMATLVGVFFAICSWFVVASLNRRLEMRKSQLQSRLTVLKDIIFYLNDFKYLGQEDKLPSLHPERMHEVAIKLNVMIELVGTKEEITLWHDFVDALNLWIRDSTHREILIPKYVKLIGTVRDNWRKEVGLSKLKD